MQATRCKLPPTIVQARAIRSVTCLPIIWLEERRRQRTAGFRPVCLYGRKPPFAGCEGGREYPPAAWTRSRPRRPRIADYTGAISDDPRRRPMAERKRISSPRIEELPRNAAAMAPEEAELVQGGGCAEGILQGKWVKGPRGSGTASLRDCPNG